MKPGHWALMVLINLLFGFNLVASKYALGEIQPLTFTALRFSLVALLLLPFLRLRRDQLPLLLGISIMLGALHFGLTYIGLNMAEDASTVAVAVQLVVPLTTILSILFLNERIGWRRALGIVLSFLGVIVMIFDPRVFDYWTALVWVVAGSLTAAIGTIWMKLLKKVGVFELQSVMATVTAPLLGITALMLEGAPTDALQNVSLVTWAAIAFSAVGTSILGHGGFYFLLQRYPVTQISPLTLMGTLFSMAFGVWLLDDVLTIRISLGAAIALGGILILVIRTGSDTVVDAPGASPAVIKKMPLNPGNTQPP